jgi:N-acetylglucosamine-6-phosphate deacetylase
MLAIQGGQVLTPLETFSPGMVLIEGEKILEVGSPEGISIPPDTQVVEARDEIIVPGFIDTHTHGGQGTYFGEDHETSKELCRGLVSTGVTSLLPTLASLFATQDTLEIINSRIALLRDVMREGTGGAEILGIHMEGPCLSSADTARGSQLVKNLREPSVDELHQMVDVSEGTIRKISIAPELPGALDMIREMVKLDIVPSAAHSTATYEETMQAVDAGLCCATHAFNGMIPLHHRKPGLLGAVLTCDDINAELIADGQHVSVVAMEILLRCKGVDRIHLITDNTSWAGMPNGTYDDVDRTIVKEDHRVYFVGGTLVGSVASMIFCVGNLLRSLDLSLPEVVQMASLNPARLIGVDDRKGSLETGKDADLLVLDKDLEVRMTMVKGQEVYRAEGW